MDVPALFEETQRFRHNPWALVGALGALAGCGSAAFVALAAGESVPWPGDVAIAFGGVLGLGLTALLLLGGMDTTVRPDGLHLRMTMLFRERHFPPAEIVSAEARRYRPIREFGGWGIRWGPGGHAYNVHGDRGVQLVLANGRRLLVGSQRAEDLARALAAVRGPAGGTTASRSGMTGG